MPPFFTASCRPILVRLIPMLHKVRLIAAIVLACAIFLPLSECSQGGTHSPPVSKSISQQLFPQTNADTTYQYAYRWLSFTWFGAVTALAFTWPLVLVLFVRRCIGSRWRWFFQVLELLLCAGTIYWLYILALRGFGATWLYGAYIGVFAAGVFTCAGVVSWFVGRQHAAEEEV
jgi:hypothetical protein